MPQLDSIQNSKVQRPKNNLDFLDRDLTPVSPNFQRAPTGNSAFFKVILLTVLIILIVGAMYVSEKIFAPNQQTSDSGFNLFHPLEQLGKLFTIPSLEKIIGEKADRINIIIGGIGGEGHDGPYLTDTLMLASLKPSTQQISLVSLPRDLIIKDQRGNFVKINELYSQGKTAKVNPAGKNLLTAISQNFNLPVPYYLIIDFAGFEKLIDDLGGIDVKVESGFTDYTYPTNNYKTKTVSFKAGWQHFNGEQALQFSRSRHSLDNNEGSDFARAHRQQLVLQAVKEKAMSWQTLLSPKKITSLMTAFAQHVDTNLDTNRLWHLYSLFKNFDISSLFTFVLDDSPENFLVGGIAQNGAYILQPKGGSWEPIALVINNLLSQDQIKAEKSKIVVLNGTQTENLAFTMTQSLRRLGFTVTNFGNAPSRDFSRTLIYDFASSTKKASADLLINFLHGLEAPYLPDALNGLKKNYPEMDLLVILGQDQQITTQPLVPWLIPTTSTSTLIANPADNGSTTKTYE